MEMLEPPFSEELGIVRDLRREVFWSCEPALLAGFAAAQHLMRLGAVLPFGVWVRRWFSAWKRVAVSVTLVMAVRPSPLRREHTLMAEAIYTFFAQLLAPWQWWARGLKGGR
jgi:hypothetical protein